TPAEGGASAPPRSRSGMPGVSHWHARPRGSAALRTATSLEGAAPAAPERLDRKHRPFESDRAPGGASTTAWIRRSAFRQECRRARGERGDRGVGELGAKACEVGGRVDVGPRGNELGAEAARRDAREARFEDAGGAHLDVEKAGDRARETDQVIAAV